MAASADPKANPYLSGRFFFIESGPLLRGMGVIRFRFIFNEFGPHVEMNDGTHGWVPLSDYTHYGLKPEDIPYLTDQDLDDLGTLFERSVRNEDPSVQFTKGPLPPPVQSQPSGTM
jgi:hypothetical protein